MVERDGPYDHYVTALKLDDLKERLLVNMRKALALRRWEPVL
jgi:hypothetical protein